MGDKYDPVKLFLEGYDYSKWSKNNEESIDKEESTDKEDSADKEECVDWSDMPSIEGNEEEVKEGKRIKILTLNKVLTILPILLAQRKAGNNSNNVKIKSYRYCIFCISIIKSLKKYT